MTAKLQFRRTSTHLCNHYPARNSSTIGFTWTGNTAPFLTTRRLASMEATFYLPPSLSPDVLFGLDLEYLDDLLQVTHIAQYIRS